MRFAPKTAAYGLFSALILALTVTGEPISAETGRNPEISPASETSQTLPAPTLNLGTDVSTTGFYDLGWELPADAAPEGYSVSRFELHERTGDADWIPFYTGADEATTLTGIPNGTYAYRVRAVLVSTESPDTVPTAWSAPQSLEVRHHSLAKAFGFLAVGAVVFIATLVLIVTGHRRSRQ